MPAGRIARTREVVIDSNVVGAWTFDEDDTPKARRAEAEVTSGRVIGVIPALFWAEFQHICGKKRYATGSAPALSLSDIQSAYEEAENLPLVEIPGELEQLRSEAWELRKRLGVGSFDAYYLALACELGVDVWTLDQDFRDLVNTNSQLEGRVKLVGVDVLP